jgi:hypothetical protein
MSRGYGVGIGRCILFERGLAEWFGWLGRAANTDSSAQGRTWEKYELSEPTDEIVVLLANIIQEAI